MCDGLRFEELSQKAKEHAKDTHRELFGYHGADNSIASLKKLAEHFGGEMIDWSIDWSDSETSNAQFEMPEMSESEIRERLEHLGSYDRKTLRGDGECKLTGYGTDEDAIDGFRRAFYLGQRRNLNDLMQAAFHSLMKAAVAEYEAEYSDEDFGETCDANEYRFCVHGDLI